MEFWRWILKQFEYTFESTFHKILCSQIGWQHSFFSFLGYMSFFCTQGILEFWKIILKHFGSVYTVDVYCGIHISKTSVLENWLTRLFLQFFVIQNGPIKFLQFCGIYRVLLLQKESFWKRILKLFWSIAL